MLEQKLSEIEGLIFELDSVLFDKSDWVLPATEFAAAQMGMPTQKAVQLAQDYIGKHGGADPQIYNHILVGCGQFDNAMNIRAFTTLINDFQPRSRSILLYPGAEESLRELRNRFKLCVVTDGPPETQKRKVIALGLHELISDIFYSDEIEGIKSRLPDPRPLLMAAKELRLRPAQLMFVGHNPVKHFLRTKEIGFITVRVLSGEYGRQDYLSEDHRADFDLPSVARLPELLEGRAEWPPTEDWGVEQSWATLAAQPAEKSEFDPSAVPQGTSFEDAAFAAIFQMTDLSLAANPAPTGEAAELPPTMPRLEAEPQEPVLNAAAEDSETEAEESAEVAAWATKPAEPAAKVTQEISILPEDTEPVDQVTESVEAIGVAPATGDVEEAREAGAETPEATAQGMPEAQEPLLQEPAEVRPAPASKVPLTTDSVQEDEDSGVLDFSTM